MFATGSSEYSDNWPGLEEPLPRVYVKFQPEGADACFLALLDTGAHFCILNQEVTAAVSDRLTNSLGQTALLTTQGRIQGELFLHRIEFIAEDGDSLGIEATTFVPPGWRGPSFIGYTGVLDRMRFAIDPQRNRFYFGPLS